MELRSGSYSGTFPSGRPYFYYVAKLPEEVFLVHAALAYELGEKDPRLHSASKRIAEIIAGEKHKHAFILSGDLGRAACSGLHTMEVDEHDGFHEVVTVDRCATDIDCEKNIDCEETRVQDYIHAYSAEPVNTAQSTDHTLVAA